MNRFLETIFIIFTVYLIIVFIPTLNLDCSHLWLQIVLGVQIVKSIVSIVHD